MVWPGGRAEHAQDKTKRHGGKYSVEIWFVFQSNQQQGLSGVAQHCTDEVDILVIILADDCAVCRADESNLQPRSDKVCCAQPTNNSCSPPQMAEET